MSDVELLELPRSSRPGWWGELLWDLNGRPRTAYDCFGEMVEACNRQLAKLVVGPTQGSHSFKVAEVRG